MKVNNKINKTKDDPLICYEKSLLYCLQTWVCALLKDYIFTRMHKFCIKSQIRGMSHVESCI
jgi:hypothetical protein